MPGARVFVLGGGIGGLSAAYFLTADPAWRERYDEVIVYQYGWRLGGKCASSRNTRRASRIEEHGLHVWFGFYENAFALMASCYSELDRPASARFRNVEQAFKPHDYVPMMEQIGDRWAVWPLMMPPMPGSPGRGENLPTLLQVFVLILERLSRWMTDNRRQDGVAQAAAAAAQPLTIALSGLRRLGSATRDAAEGLISRGIVHALRELRDVVQKVLSASVVDELRRGWILADLGLTVVIGALEDDLARNGLSSIDHLEFRAWLERHGASRIAIDSTPVRALYDTCFAYRDGDVRRPDFAAGTALGCALRIGLMYRGSVLYEMQAGMGEIVIAPLYQVLRKRGVRFEFFEKVSRLELDLQARRVARIHFGRQATVLQPPYDPLIDVDGLPCWPSEPRYEQLAEGVALRDRQIDLTSHWAQWPDVKSWPLDVRPQDKVVLAIPLGALGDVARELCSARQAWRDLVVQLPVIQTQSVQLWLRRDLRALGWSDPKPAMVGAPEPLDVWANLTHLITEERWDRADAPRSLHYLCGPLAGAFTTMPPTDPTVPEKARGAVRAQTVEWLNAYARWIWPNAVDAQGRFDWKVLHGPAGAQEIAALDEQWLRANVDPSETYVLSPAVFNKLRLPPDGSDFENLVLAGDWTRTPINAGCVEAAVMSGMQASRALGATLRAIAGENWLPG